MTQETGLDAASASRRRFFILRMLHVFNGSRSTRQDQRGGNPDLAQGRFRPVAGMKRLCMATQREATRVPSSCDDGTPREFACESGNITKHQSVFGLKLWAFDHLAVHTMNPIVHARVPSPRAPWSGLLALGLGILAAPHSGAAVLFVVDVSNRAAVTITATDGRPLGDDPDFTWTADGATLLGFFTADAGDDSGFLAGGGTLKPAESVHTYNSWQTDDYSMGADFEVDLNVFYTGFEDDPQGFDTAQRAFVGSAALDLSAHAARLPAPGTTGQILAGDSLVNQGLILGEYTVVPEIPATAQAAVFGLGAGGLLLLRRRRSAA